MVVDTPYYPSEFIELLLQLLSGDKGEIAIATAYMLQAAGDTDASRKAVLSRIIVRKIRHLDILGAILASVYRFPRNNLKTFHSPLLLEMLEDYGIPTGPFRALIKKNPSRIACSTAIKFSRHPRKFLESCIGAEGHQIIIYDCLLELTHNSIFIHALRVARNQLIRSRKELIHLLEIA